MGVTSNHFSPLLEIPFELPPYYIWELAYENSYSKLRPPEFSSLVSPASRARARQKFLVKGAPNNFEGLPRVKADSADVGVARGSSSFAHIFLALRLVNILLRVAPSVCCPGHYSLSLSSRSSSSLLRTNGRSCRAELHSFARILIVHVTVLFQGKCSRENVPVATITSYD